MGLRMKRVASAVCKALAAVCLIGTLAVLLLWAGWPPVEDTVGECWSVWRYTVYVSVHEQELLEDVRRVEAGKLARISDFDFVYRQGDVTWFGTFSYSADIRAISATDTHGIYYSPQDEPLTATDEGHDFKTRRLRKNWFWYEEYF